MGVFSGFVRTRPATVPTDRIIPLRFWDDLSYLRSLSHAFTFRLDDVLDDRKLREALQKLMETGDWGQLGARLRLNDAGNLEYHIPAQYSETRPAFIFTTAKHDMRINDHPLGSLLPKSAEQPCLAPSGKKFAPLVCSPGCPRVLDDWIYSDHPQLNIHVVLFRDATLLTITHLHTLMDAVGLSSLLQAWTAVLRGQEDEVPSFHSFAHDPLLSLGIETPPEKYLNFKRIVRGVGLLLFAIYYAFDLLFRGDEEHVICFPGRLVDRMRKKAQAEVAAQSDMQEPPFLSEGDIILSWWMQTTVRALRPASGRAVTVLNVFDIRGLFNEALIANSAYVSNAIFHAYSLFLVPQILDEDLGFLAIQNRRAVVQHRTKEQVYALAAIQRESFMKTAPLFGKSNLLFLACTNHHKARFFETDFSAAIVSPGVPFDKRANSPGRPSYINVIEHSNGCPTRNLLKVIGKDSAGNWWLTSTLRREPWLAMKGQFMDLVNKSK